MININFTQTKQGVYDPLLQWDCSNLKTGAIMKKFLVLFSALTLVVGLTACETAEDAFAGSIRVYTRDTSSGTRAGFMEGIGFDEAVANDAVIAAGFVIAGNLDQVNAVQIDPYAVGYVSLSTLDTNLFRGFAFNGVEPNEANVLNGTYQLSRRFNWMLRDDYSVYGADAEAYEQLSLAFVAYMGSREGKASIAQGGGIVDLSTGESWNTLRTQFPICSQDNSRLTLKIGGSDSVESLAKRISPGFSTNCGNVVPEHNHTGSSNGFRGTNGDASAINDGLSVHVGFASREFRPTEPARRIGVMAIDAIVVIGHLDNPIESLTKEQVKSIYDGTVTDWSELIG
jgi:phosphate transport system substrate-binding protein